MFYALVDYQCKDAFFITDDDSIPRAFDTEADALKESKDYGGPTIILRGVARVTEKTTHKVEKIK